MKRMIQAVARLFATMMFSLLELGGWPRLPPERPEEDKS